MKIRKKFHNDITIKIIKNRVVQKSFEKINDIVGLDQLSSKLEGQCALMFTNISPFKLNLIFDQNKVYLPAKGGDVTKMDITIPSGNTGISPGPVLFGIQRSKRTYEDRSRHNLGKQRYQSC